MLTKVFIGVFLVGVASAGLCPDGWVSGGSSCYKFVMKSMDWHAANGICRDMGGKLATVDTMEKSAFVAGYILLNKSLRTGRGFWTSARLSANAWQWAADDIAPHAMTFSNWLPIQPDSNGAEDCIEVIATDAMRVGKWNDISCSHKSPFPLCERPAAVLGSNTNTLVG